MDSALAGRPLRDALVALTASDCTDTELLQLLIHMVDGSMAAADKTTKWGEKYEVWEVAGAEEDIVVSVVPTPMSTTVSVRPTSFAAWETQGLAEAYKIRAVYALLIATDEEIIGELLS